MTAVTGVKISGMDEALEVDGTELVEVTIVVPPVGEETEPTYETKQLALSVILSAALIEPTFGALTDSPFDNDALAAALDVSFAELPASTTQVHDNDNVVERWRTPLNTLTCAYQFNYGIEPIGASIEFVVDSGSAVALSGHDGSTVLVVESDKVTPITALGYGYHKFVLVQIVPWVWARVTPLIESTALTGAEISFQSKCIYNSPGAAATANITEVLTGARTGIVQKVFHSHSTEPTFPAGWVRVGTGVYVTGELNIIFCEWISGTRVEYWIVQ